MKYPVLLNVLLVASQISGATPSVTILACNTPFGPDQEVKVQRDEKHMTLVELTNSGATVSRELSFAEWQSGKLSLREENGFRTTLIIEGHNEGRLHTTDGAGYNEYGPADCE